MSSDASLFSDRPIRPLPKRRLRERLSPEVADSIQYPPAPRGVPPLFQYPYTLKDEEAESTPFSRDRNVEIALRSGRGGAGTDSEEAQGQRQGGRGNTGQDGRSGRTPPTTDHRRHTNSHLAPSAASSVDGYDLLENTNNKKKRKIPSAGDAALNSIHIINDAAAVGSASFSDTSPSADNRGEALSPTSTPYYGSGSFASGSPNVPGPGRGRYGRLRSSRSPLRPLSDSTNNWAGRNGKSRPSQWTSGAAENTGIISTAIANAEKLPQHGQENMSLLHHQPTAKRSPGSTQFTFTCDSQVPGSLAWPGSDRKGPISGPQQTPGRPTNENWTRGNQVAQAGHTSPTSRMPEAGQKEVTTNNSASPQAQQANAQKSSRRSAAKEYAAAAKARRRETLLYNKRHPPKPEDVWICHFCEYESIFGRPPEALVRQYEINDRKQRQLEQQRRAQWERMKKGKHKGKKHSKLPAKTISQAQEPHQAAGVDGGHANSNYSQGTQSEEGYCEEEDYDEDDYDPDDEIPPLEDYSGDFSQHDHHPAPLIGDLSLGGT